ncbi:MAG: LptF/LptG family permease [Planctomycetota bacterium]
MKRIDRYITVGYLVRFVATVLIIFGLYISFDAVKRIDQIQQNTFAETVPNILRFYAYQFPARILDFLPSLLLIAAGLLLVQMSRNREILTLKASGVSLHRIVMPIFLVTVPLIALSFYAREEVVPWSSRRQQLLEYELDRKSGGELFVEDKQEDFRIFVGQYDFLEHEMENVTVLRFYETGEVRTVIEADTCRWGEDDKLMLDTVSIQQFAENGNKSGEEARTEMVLDTGLTPYDFLAAREDDMENAVPTFTLTQLHNQARNNPDNPRFSVMFHSRLAGPVSVFVILLIGIPIMVGFEHKLRSRVLGVAICILVAAIYQVMSFVSVSMGNTGILPPPIAAWIVPAIGLTGGTVLFMKMRT